MFFKFFSFKLKLTILFYTDFCSLPDTSSIICDSQFETKNCKSCNYNYLGRWNGDFSRSLILE